MTGPTETRKICNLKVRKYGDIISGNPIDCEPTAKDISDAIQSGRLETRNYQTDIEDLKAEWLSESEKSSNFVETWKRVVTGYHAARIAHFVENGWTLPISINANAEVTDGTHRIKAAIFKGFSDIEVSVEK